jgi:hypothetical protein
VALHDRWPLKTDSIHMKLKFSMTRQEKGFFFNTGDCLLEGTTLAGLTSSYTCTHRWLLNRGDHMGRFDYTCTHTGDCLIEVTTCTGLTIPAHTGDCQIEVTTCTGLTTPAHTGDCQIEVTTCAGLTTLAHTQVTA